MEFPGALRQPRLAGTHTGAPSTPAELLGTARPPEVKLLSMAVGLQAGCNSGREGGADSACHGLASCWHQVPIRRLAEGPAESSHLLRKGETLQKPQLWEQCRPLHTNPAQGSTAEPKKLKSWHYCAGTQALASCRHNQTLPHPAWHVHSPTR